MTDVELEILLHRILHGSLIFFYKNERYELRAISNYTRYEADLLYNKIVNEEKYNEWIRSDNADYFLINLGLWTKDTPKLLEQLDKRIENLKVELYENFMNTNMQKKIRNNLLSARKQLDSINNTKAEFVSHTLEGYASSIKYEFTICNSLYKNSKKVFDFDSRDHNSLSLSVFNDLVNEINKHNISIADFRALARSYLWKSYWNVHKTNSIFEGAVSDWTDDQRSLVSFSQMYDSIYEHPECPSDKILSDDDMLDGWMISQRRKIEKAKKQTTIDNLNPNLKKANEVFLFGKGAEEVEEILSLNSAESMGRMKEKINYINHHGKSDDAVLPDNQRQIMIESQKLASNRK